MPATLELPLKAPRKLTLLKGSVINRGLKELAPKYHDPAKIAGYLLRQISRNRISDLASTHIFMPFAGPEAERLAGILNHPSSLLVSAPLLGSLIDRLYTVTGKTAIAVVSPADPPVTDDYLFAKALMAHDRNFELNLLRDLIHRALDAEKIAAKEHLLDREAIVVEERSGRFGRLALEEPSIRAQIKKWQHHLASSTKEAKDATKAPSEASAGFGAGAIILSDQPSPDHEGEQKLFFAASSLMLHEPLSIELIANWNEVVAHWLRDLGIPIESLRRVYISSPFLATSAFLGQAFLGKDSSGPMLMYPDQIYGWHPLLTLMAMLRQPQKPSLFMYIGANSTLHLAATWDAP